MTRSSIYLNTPSWQSVCTGGAAIRRSFSQIGTMTNGLFQKARENPGKTLLAGVAIASMIGLGVCLSKGMCSSQEMELRCVKDLTDDEVAYCAEVPAGLSPKQFSDLTFRKSLVEKNYYPSPEPGRDEFAFATWNKEHNVTLTKSLAEKNYYPSPETEHLTYSQLSGRNEEFVSATWDQRSIDYPTTALSAASLSGALIGIRLLRNKKPTNPLTPPSTTIPSPGIPQVPLNAPPPPKAPPPPPKAPPPPPKAPQTNPPSDKKRTPLSEEGTQRLIQRHNEVTLDIQTRRAQIRALGEKNKDARSKISLVRGSIQSNTERLEFSRRAIEQQEKSLAAYKDLLAELEKNPTKQLQCSEETQKSGAIAVVLDNTRAIAKLRGDIIKSSKDLVQAREEIISLGHQIGRSEMQLEAMLAAPAIGADVTMGELERHVQDLERALKEVQAQLAALNREMAEHGIKPNGKGKIAMQQTEVDPSQAKEHMMKQMEERLITMRVLDPKNLRLV